MKKGKTGEIRSRVSENSLFCTCGKGEVVPIKELACAGCGNNLIRCAEPKYHCTGCMVVIGQVFFYKCSGCGGKSHCRNAWNCNKSCIAEFKCTGCGAMAKEQVKISNDEKED